MYYNVLWLLFRCTTTKTKSLFTHIMITLKLYGLQCHFIRYLKEFFNFKFVTIINQIFRHLNLPCKNRRHWCNYVTLDHEELTLIVIKLNRFLPWKTSLRDHTSWNSGKTTCHTSWTSGKWPPFFFRAKNWQ